MELITVLTLFVTSWRHWLFIYREGNSSGTVRWERRGGQRKGFIISTRAEKSHQESEGNLEWIEDRIQSSQLFLHDTHQLYEQHFKALL